MLEEKLKELEIDYRAIENKTKKMIRREVCTGLILIIPIIASAFGYYNYKFGYFLFMCGFFSCAVLVSIIRIIVYIESFLELEKMRHKLMLKLGRNEENIII